MKTQDRAKYDSARGYMAQINGHEERVYMHYRDGWVNYDTGKEYTDDQVTILREV